MLTDDDKVADNCYRHIYYTNIYNFIITKKIFKTRSINAVIIALFVLNINDINSLEQSTT